VCSGSVVVEPSKEKPKPVSSRGQARNASWCKLRRCRCPSSLYLVIRAVNAFLPSPASKANRLPGTFAKSGTTVPTHLSVSSHNVT
jgi:hypothetical protein